MEQLRLPNKTNKPKKNKTKAVKNSKKNSENKPYKHPIPSRNELLEFLTDAGKPLKADAILAGFGLKGQRMRSMLVDRLGKMLRAGQIIEMDSMPTISDGTAGGIEKDSITFELCQEYVDEFVILTEEEIMAAITLMLEREYMLIEGAAALPVAALIKMNSGFEDKNIILIISGKRISLDKLNFD
jgi:hypothetical protein